jgi:hypothetical protein
MRLGAVLGPDEFIKVGEAASADLWLAGKSGDTVSVQSR